MTLLQPGYPSHFEVEQINVCPMALQPLNCRLVQRRLAVYSMALQPLNCRVVQHRVAEMPPKTAHPIFLKCNRSRIAVTTIRTVAAPLAVHPVRWTCRSTGSPRSSTHPIHRLECVMASGSMFANSDGLIIH